jgi:caa(3)-type oxidase subunit IV
MLGVISRRQHFALLALLMATATSYLVSHANFIDAWAGVATLGIAYFKARLVILDFMELRQASALWRIGFEGGLLVLSLILVAMYVSGKS